MHTNGFLLLDVTNINIDVFDNSQQSWTEAIRDDNTDKSLNNLVRSLYESGKSFFEQSLQYKMNFQERRFKHQLASFEPFGTESVKEEKFNRNPNTSNINNMKNTVDVEKDCPDLIEFYYYQWQSSFSNLLNKNKSNILRPNITKIPNEFEIQLSNNNNDTYNINSTSNNDDVNMIDNYAYYLTKYVLHDILFKIASLALNQSENYFFNHYSQSDTFINVVRLSNYFDISNKKKEKKFCGTRLGAHCDFIGFTLLYAPDNISGLQLMDEKGLWHDVVIPNIIDNLNNNNNNDNSIAFIVNCGEMIQQRTNGHWVASLHRVIPSSTQQRFSIAFFTEPSDDTIMQPYPDCYVCNKDEFKFDAQLTVKQHVTRRAAQLQNNM